MKLAIACALACSLAAPPAAQACQCELSAALDVTPSPRQPVPPAPTFYIFSPNNLHDGTLLVHDVAVRNLATLHPNDTFVVRQVAVNPEYVVLAIHSEATEGIIELSYTYGRPETVGYMISRDAPVHAVRPVQLEVTDRTDCGMSNEKAITIDFEGDAVAYSLQWSDGASTIVPAQRVWEGSSQYMRIGARCGNTNVAFERLHRAEPITVYALFADGKFQLVGTSTLELGTESVRLPVELLDLRADSVTPQAPIIVHATADTNVIAIAGGAAGGSALVLGAAFIVRRRRRGHVAKL